MSAQTRAIQNVSSLDVIEELSDLVANPNKIKDIHKIIREEISLTEAEKQKAEEGKDFIKNYEKIKKEIEDSKLNLKNNTDEYDKKIKNFNDNISNFDIEQKKLLEENNKKENNLQLKEEQLLTNIDNFNTEKENFIKFKESVESSFDDKEIFLKELEETLNNKQKDLKLQEQILKDKFDKIKETMGNIGNT